MPETAVLIVAAGRGERAGAGISKQYRNLGGKPVLRWSAEAFLAHPDIRAVRCVIRGEDAEMYRASVGDMGLQDPVIGGATRQESVRNGLEALAASAPQYVLIHDAARPLVSGNAIGRVIGALDGADAAAPFLGVAYTLRRKCARGYETVPRENLFRAQTPQGFRFPAILEAHRAFAGTQATDDIEIAERAGLTIAPVQGEEMNLKLTTAEDFALAERLASSALSDVRTGTGIDAHGFTDGDHVWLCGVKIPHDAGLAGHSDADAGLHALTDAILGAISAADIGVHFPPSDVRWRKAPSHLFLQHAASLVRDLKGIISHVDVTIICERPKVAPYRDAMRARVAEILGIDLERVSVKATTTDGLGFTGRREGIAAQATATVRLPS